MSWALVGWLGNGCFFARFALQWWSSERAGRSVAPRHFWWLSLAGAACLVAYTSARGELVLVCGQLVNAAIYVRNLSLGSGAGRRRGLAPGLAAGLALAAGGALFASGALRPRADLADAPLWLLASVAGQGLWSARFVVQWVASERRRDSHFPESFWWVSLAGNALLLAYSLHLLDAVLVAGYCLGPVVQVRNLVLGRRRAAPAEVSRAPGARG
jgi:lipid-A-disaccharide synthase-like uncharacterized protein